MCPSRLNPDRGDDVDRSDAPRQVDVGPLVRDERLGRTSGLPQADRAAELRDRGRNETDDQGAI